jgi:hypothetical protein
VAFAPPAAELHQALDGEIRLWNVADGKTTAHFVAAPGFKVPEVSAAVAK